MYFFIVVFEESFCLIKRVKCVCFLVSDVNEIFVLVKMGNVVVIYLCVNNSEIF